MSPQQEIKDTERFFGRVFTAIGGGVCLLFSAIGLLIMNSAVTHTLDCRRLEPTQGNCTFKTLYGPLKQAGESQQFSLKDFQRAQLDEMVSSDTSDSRSTLLYSAQIVVANEPIPLSTSYSTERSSKLATIEQINQFLQNNQSAQLHLEQSDNGFYIAGGMFMGIGNIVGLPFLIVGIACWRSASKPSV